MALGTRVFLACSPDEVSLFWKMINHLSREPLSYDDKSSIPRLTPCVTPRQEIRKGMYDCVSRV